MSRQIDQLPLALLDHICQHVRYHDSAVFSAALPDNWVRTPALTELLYKTGWSRVSAGRYQSRGSDIYILQCFKYADD